MHQRSQSVPFRAAFSFAAALALLAGCHRPACSQDSDCDDQNPCTVDSCSQGACQSVADDTLVPAQAAPDDCKRQVCQGGAVTDVSDDAEIPQGAPDDCKREACQGGTVIELSDDSE